MRCIDADALIHELNNSHYPGAPYIDAGISIAIGKVGDAPTVEPEPKWIPCKERLPEEDGEYLVLYHTRSAYKPYVYDVTSFANDLYKIDEYDFYDEKGQKGWFYYDREYGYCEDDSVIAWMPLPEPYKGEGGNE